MHTFDIRYNTLSHRLQEIGDAQGENGQTMLNLTQLAQDLPESVRFGCSSWNYPGWQGLVYSQQYKSAAAFKRDSLAEYAKFPLFRTVGVDSSFYAPPKKDALLAMTKQVPPDFRWVSKVWERVTIWQYPKHPRYGAFAGQENPDFLNADLFLNQVLSAYDWPEILPFCGPFVFQFATFSSVALQSLEFTSRLDAFLQKLPKHFRYAVEVRNPAILTNAYFECLNRNGVTHCFNHWNYMPKLSEQMRLAAHAGGLTAPFYVCRALTPLGVNYSEAVKTFEPYSSIQRPNPEMRTDIGRLIKRAREQGFEAYIIVNNRSEGCAPLTITALAESLKQNLANADQ